MKIWVLVWSTWSGDSGVTGYWTKKPTTKAVKEFVKDAFPDDYEANSIGYSLFELLPR